MPLTDTGSIPVKTGDVPIIPVCHGLQDIENKVRRLVQERDYYADQLLRKTASAGRLKKRAERRLNWSMTGWSLFIISVIVHILRSK